MAEDLTEQSEAYKAGVEAMVGISSVDIPFWERAQIRPRELTALQLEKRKLEWRLEAEAWHKVDEQMPDDDITVLTYSAETDGYRIAFHAEDEWFDAEDGEDYFIRLIGITHWKELIPPEKVQ